MGGGGGGGSFSSTKPEDLARLVRKAEDETTVAAFEGRLSDLLGNLLGTANARDHVLIQERLDDIKTSLEAELEGTIDQLFGGSVAKHTYVDGLSDVDCLLMLDDTKLEDHTPHGALARLEGMITKALPAGARVSAGRMAVTIDYADGMQLQLLPALKLPNGRLKVPSSRRDDWSHINPATFQKALTRRNEQCGGKLVPTIKLAKAINAEFPKTQRLSGYHIESLAIAAFRDYKGKKTVAAMLPAFFERAKSLVLSPIRDSTGQSVHVDAYLGKANSLERVAAQHLLWRVEKRMRNASASNSLPQWRAMFGIDE